MKFPAGDVVRFSDDGGLLVCLGRNVVVIDAAARQRLSTTHPFSHPSHASFSPDSAKLAVKNTQGRIVVIDPRSGDILNDPGDRKEGEGCEVVFSADGEQLIDGSWNGAVTIRDSADGTIYSRQIFPGEMITRISNDRQRLTWLIQHSPKVGSGENVPPPDYVSVGKCPFGPSTARTLSLGVRLRSATLSPDGRHFCLIELSNDRLHIARASDAEVVASSEPTNFGGTGFDLAWSPDCQYIASVQRGKFVFYGANDLSVVGQVPSEYPSSASFHPDGEHVALGSWITSAVVKFGDVLAGRVTL